MSHECSSHRFQEFISDDLSVDSRNPQLKDLNIDFKKFDEMVAWHLKVYTKHSYYNQKLGEFPEPSAPKPLNDDYEHYLRRKIRLGASSEAPGGSGRW